MSSGMFHDPTVGLDVDLMHDSRRDVEVHRTGMICSACRSMLMQVRDVTCDCACHVHCRESTQSTARFVHLATYGK